MKIKVETGEYHSDKITINLDGTNTMVLYNKHREDPAYPIIEKGHPLVESFGMKNFHFITGDNGAGSIDSILLFWGVSKRARWAVRQIMKLEVYFNKKSDMKWVSKARKLYNVTLEEK